LERGAARRREIALRYSLGATRGRLVRQSLTESLLLALAGCVLGVLLAHWGEVLVMRFLPQAAGEPLSGSAGGTVLLFTAGASLLSALLFGLAPALRSTAIDPAFGLHARGAGTGERRPALRRALVAAQVAFSVVLVVLAGLFGRSLGELRGIDPGFRNENVISFHLSFPRAWNSEDTRTARERFLAQAERLPGVLSLSYGFPGPYQGGSANSTLRVPGSQQTANETADVEMQYAGARFFETIGSVPILGRDFHRSDTLQGRKVAVVNEAFVRTFFPDEPNPLGRTLSFDRETTYIVGVVRNMTHYGLKQKPQPTVYVPFAQVDPNWPPAILVRAQRLPAEMLPALRREVEKLGTQVALTEPKTIRQQVDDSIFQDRLLAAVSGFFGVLALALAGIGLYGVVSYGTARRAAEIGIRIALGARRGSVVWMVLRDALLLVAIGLAAGIPFAIAAARAVESILFGVKPADPVAFLGTACVLAAVGMAAAFLPARRAATIEPVQVLRQE
jgi:predicted permease